jgi:hypothetical protein
VLLRIGPCGTTSAHEPRVRAFLAFALATVGVLAACSSSSSTTIQASDYDQSCATSADCVPIAVGDLCECSCAASAINRKDEARYEADVRDRLSRCTSHPYCGACDDVRATCVAGRCAIVD